ncbi:uncharacterized protein FSUBG_4951 [Fusarium subglutinans]|uniref:Actin-like ATPase domain-containing protein n=1 Tax=Gibberella subglutinans TaxID=42677 RepID=A0A8H5Q3R7_GIBSU|nr:uncharacterized protein FSUBG_4951 [Fusarium subglutinans]KAF5608127.1 hypothetical protein FSUBG_4951 [Fusarium subglutinans]
MAEDLVVGIDVGMSGTGVAYRRKGYAEVTCLEWGIDKKDPKTPTRVFYNVRDQPPKLVGWGMDVPDDSVEHLELREWFKVDLGAVDADRFEVKRIYRDFLTSLFYELSTHRFTPAILGGKSFEEASVLFLFSVPALWGPAVVEDFMQLVRESGFEEKGLRSARVTMTEPQAVAAYEICVPNSEYKLKNGENVLIVDAGGGTTVTLPPVACTTGSTFIDQGFEEMVMAYLQDKRDSLVRDIDDVSWDLRNSNLFHIGKREFDPDNWNDLEFNIPLKNSAPTSVVLTGSLFNRQIDEINKNIGSHVKAFMTDSGTNSENHLVRHKTGREWGLSLITQEYIILAGGLGSSRYVLGKIEEFMGKLPFKLAAKPKVVMSAAPRLAVCMGLVHNAGRNPELFPRRFNRVSIGVASQSLTDKIKNSRFHNFIKRAFLRAPKGQKPGGEVEWVLVKGELVPDRVAVPEQTAYFSADLPSNQRIWELAILHSFESDIERLTLGGKPLTPDGAWQILTYTDACRVHSVLRVNLSHIGEPDKVVAGDALARLHLARKPKIPIKFDLRIEVGLATAEIHCTDKKGRLCSDPISIPTGYELVPATGQSAVYELS